MRQRLTEADRAEWAHFVRHVAPLPGRLRPETSAELPPAAVQLRDRPATTVPRRGALLGAPTIGVKPAGIDNATWHRFRSSRLPVGRTLDLHGQTAHRAFDSLRHFLRAAQADEVRAVEIITGRGSVEGGGVLRRELPLWLNLAGLRPFILAAVYTNPGAVRLLLRRVR